MVKVQISSDEILINSIYFCWNRKKLRVLPITLIIFNKNQKIQKIYGLRKKQNRLINHLENVYYFVVQINLVTCSRLSGETKRIKNNQFSLNLARCYAINFVLVYLQNEYSQQPTTSERFLFFTSVKNLLKITPPTLNFGPPTQRARSTEPKGNVTLFFLPRIFYNHATLTWSIISPQKNTMVHKKAMIIVFFALQTVVRQCFSPWSLVN